jgi:hypothetical protein
MNKADFIDNISGTSLAKYQQEFEGLFRDCIRLNTEPLILTKLAHDASRMGGRPGLPQNISCRN